jgi:hypothetical protein
MGDDKHAKPASCEKLDDVGLTEVTIRSGSFKDDASVRPDLSATTQGTPNTADSSAGSDEG